jgi:hypothetical protein
MSASFPCPSDMNFVYAPLEDEDEIQLSRPVTTANETTVLCAIEYVKLHANPFYEDFSYVWGPPEFQKPIQIGQKIFHVRGSLWSALIHLSHEIESRYLWIDELCTHFDR